MEFFTHNLPNGIRCLLLRVKSPVAWCAMTVNAGSRDERAEEYGVAHFTEHMLFKGTAVRRAHHINNRLEKLGGELNAYTTKEETVIYATTLRSDFSKAAELIADIVFRSAFPMREVVREREVVVDEINSYKDSPSELIFDEFEDLLFAGSPLGHNILGTRASVGRLDDRALHGFVGRTYNTDQMVFSAAGNITPRAFVATVERWLGDVQASPRGFARATPPQFERFDRTANRSLHQAHCVLGARAYDTFDPRRNALSLLVNIIGGPAANSRLSTLLREKNGLTYAADAGYTPLSDTGVATIYFATERDKMGRCRELVDGLLTELRTTALTTRQLAAAKKQYIGQLAIAMEGRESAMLGAAKSLLLYNAVDQPAEIYRKINAITASELLDAANDVFGDLASLTYGAK